MKNREEVIEHLRMIQNIISRMGNNSFLLKGWAATLMVAIYGFVSGTNIKMIIVTIIPIIGFWILDAYFLLLERKYRLLYDNIRTKEKTDFNMDISNLNINITNIKKYSLMYVLFSKTLVGFYGAGIVFAIILYYFK